MDGSQGEGHLLGDVGKVPGLERVLVHFLHHLARVQVLAVVFIVIIGFLLLFFFVALIVLTRGPLCMTSVTLAGETHDTHDTHVHKHTHTHTPTTHVHTRRRVQLRTVKDFKELRALALEHEDIDRQLLAQFGRRRR